MLGIHAFSDLDAVFDWIDPTKRASWDPATRAWYVSSYQDVVDLLVDSRLKAKREHLQDVLSPEEWEIVKPLRQVVSQWPVFSDPPLHTAQRRLMLDSFKPEAIALVFSAAVQELHSQHYDECAGFLRAVRSATTAGVAKILGVSPELCSELQNYSGDVIRTVSVGPGDIVREEIEAGLESYRRLSRIVLDSGSAPAGLIASAGRAVKSGSVSQVQAVGVVSQILTGTLEPTLAVIRLGTELLWEDQRYRAMLASSPRRFISELIRLCTPFHFAPRFTESSIELGDVTIPDNSNVILVLALANRDPGAFPQGAEVDISAETPTHLAFGRGRHACLGAKLVHLLAEMALSEALESTIYRTCHPSDGRWVISAGMRRWEPENRL
jgi:cytochrome P450